MDTSIPTDYSYSGYPRGYGTDIGIILFVLVDTLIIDLLILRMVKKQEEKRNP